MGNSESNIEGGVTLDELYEDIMKTENHKIYLCNDKLEELHNKITMYIRDCSSKNDEKYKNIIDKYKEYLVMLKIRPMPFFPQLQNTCFYDATMHLLSSIKYMKDVFKNKLDEFNKDDTIVKSIVESICKSYPISKFNESTYKKIFPNLAFVYGETGSIDMALGNVLGKFNIEDNEIFKYIIYSEVQNSNVRDFYIFNNRSNPESAYKNANDQIEYYRNPVGHNWLDNVNYFYHTEIKNKPQHLLIMFSHPYVYRKYIPGYTLSGIIFIKRTKVHMKELKDKKEQGIKKHYVLDVRGFEFHIYMDNNNELFIRTDLFDISDDSICRCKNGYLYPKRSLSNGRYLDSNKHILTNVHETGNMNLVYMNEFGLYYVEPYQTCLQVIGDDLYRTHFTSSHFVCYFPVHEIYLDSFDAFAGIKYRHIKKINYYDDNYIIVPDAGLYVRTDDNISSI